MSAKKYSKTLFWSFADFYFSKMDVYIPLYGNYNHIITKNSVMR